MKKKALMLTTVLAIVSGSAVAKVTEADVAGHSAWTAAQNPSLARHIVNQQWSDYNRPPEEPAKGERVRKWYNAGYVMNRTNRNTSGHEIIVRARGGQHTWYANRCSLVVWVNGVEADSSKLILPNASSIGECTVSAAVPKSGWFKFGYRHSIGGSGTPWIRSAVYQ